MRRAAAAAAGARPRGMSAAYGRLSKVSEHLCCAAAGGGQDVKMVDEQRLRALVEAVLAGVGSSRSEQQIVSDHLVEAMLKGHDSHGVQMLSGYIRSAQDGHLFPNAAVKLVGSSGPMLTVDAGGYTSGGFGMVAAREATLLAAGVAKEHGVSILTLRNAHHIGRVGTYAELAAEQGLISQFYTNGTGVAALVAPFGGAEARLTTNPYTCGIPSVASDGGAMVLDFATSIVANGKVMNYANKGLSMFLPFMTMMTMMTLPFAGAAL